MRFRQAFTHPPEGPLEIDSRSPLARGLIFCVLPSQQPGSGTLIDLVRGWKGVMEGGAAPGHTALFPHTAYANTESDKVVFAGLHFSGVMTIAAWINSSYAISASICGEFDTGANTWMFYWNTAWAYYTLWDGDDRIKFSKPASATNNWTLVTVANRPTVAAAGYINGVDTTTTTTAASWAAGAGNFAISNWGSYPLWGHLGALMIYDRVLSAQESWQLWAPQTRWGFVRPARRLWVASPAPAAPPPNAPSGLTATASASDTIDLAWTDNSLDETGFKVQRSLNGSTWADLDTAAADATSYPDETCSPSTTYYYRVCATNGAGDSAYTDAASAKTPPATAVLAYKYLVINGGQLTQTDGRYVALVDGVPEPDTVAGVTWLYVDQTTGDLTAKFGDGHKTTVAADS